MTQNASWHDTHPMPRGATTSQRIAWHVEHARRCGCRPIPAKLVAEMARRGVAPVAAPAAPVRGAAKPRPR